MSDDNMNIDSTEHATPSVSLTDGVPGAGGATTGDATSGAPMLAPPHLHGTRLALALTRQTLLENQAALVERGIISIDTVARMRDHDDAAATPAVPAADDMRAHQAAPLLLSLQPATVAQNIDDDGTMTRLQEITAMAAMQVAAEQRVAAEAATQRAAVDVAREQQFFAD